MVKTLDFAGIEAPVPGFGCMGMSQSFGPSDDTESLATLKHAVDIGCTFWDTAVVYGRGHNETLLGRFFAANPSAREKVFVGSKCGFDCLGSDGETPTSSAAGATTSPNEVTNKPEHIRAYIEASRKRMGSYPDLYYLHRIDPDTPIEESVAALDEVRKQGKTRYIGLSECSEATLRRACKVAQIDALQIEYSPWEASHARTGLIAAARELGVTVVAFSPLGRGVLTGKFKSADDFAPEGDYRRTLPRYNGDNLSHNMQLVSAIETLANKKGCTPGQLSIAWVIAEGAIPIPGTRKISRLDENFGARGIVLSPEEKAEIDRIVTQHKPAGERYGQAALKMIGK